MQRVREIIHSVIHNDLVQVNAPNTFTIATLTFAQVQAYATLMLTLTSIACTILLTFHKMTKKKDDE